MEFNGVMRILMCGPFEPDQVFSEQVVGHCPKGFGGVPVNLLVSELAAMGHEVTVVGTSSHIKKLWSLKSGNVKAILVPSRKRARTLALTQFNEEISSLVKVMANIDFDVLHAHWTYEFAIAALKVDRNTVVTAHDAPLTIFRWFKDPYRFFRLLMAVRVRFLVRNLTCVSPYLSKKWQVEMFWRKQISVIPNICPFPPIEERHNFPNAARIVTIGDSTKRKNVKSLILAFHEIVKLLPFATLQIFGHGLDADGKLAHWAKENSIDFGLQWHGFASRSKIKEALDKSDLLIHPSYEEAQPMVPLEAMSRGIPIIGGLGSGGVPWTLDSAGALVNVKKPSKIAEKAVEILTSTELSETMSATGLHLVREKYSPRNVAELYLNVYARVVHSREDRLRAKNKRAWFKGKLWP